MLKIFAVLSAWFIAAPAFASPFYIKFADCPVTMAGSEDTPEELMLFINYKESATGPIAVGLVVTGKNPSGTLSGMAATAEVEGIDEESVEDTVIFTMELGLQVRLSGVTSGSGKATAELLDGTGLVLGTYACTLTSNE